MLLQILFNINTCKIKSSEDFFLKYKIGLKELELGLHTKIYFFTSEIYFNFNSI